MHKDVFSYNRQITADTPAVTHTPVLTDFIYRVVNNGTSISTWLKTIVTLVPKNTQPTDFSHLRLRPISVTPVMSCVTERLIVRKYLLPACLLTNYLTSLPTSLPDPLLPL